MDINYSLGGRIGYDFSVPFYFILNIRFEFIWALTSQKSKGVKDFDLKWAKVHF